MTGADYSVGGLPLYRLDVQRRQEARPTENGGNAAHPGQVAQLALSQWNAYLRTDHDANRRQFLDHISWLMVAELRAAPDLSVWPTSAAAGEAHDYHQYLSAGIQGAVGSALLRAHLLLGDEVYLQAARRALAALDTEILDGGVSSVVGADGLCFEDVAVYPAAHILSGFVLGLMGLHDYFKQFREPTVGELIERSTSTLHSLICLYDTGYWTRIDLLGKRLATVEEHAFHVSLLRALVSYSGCSHCANLADRWAGYQRRGSRRLRRALAEPTAACRRRLAGICRRLLFRSAGLGSPAATRGPVCIVLPAFPVPGGTRAIVASMAKVMADEWDVVYLTHQVGTNPGDRRIEQFGGGRSSYWQFPNVWFYSWAGLRRLIGMVRRGNSFRLILPQDGSYTALFAGIVGRAYGARVVSVEHGTVTFPYNRVYRAERVAGVGGYGAIRQVVSRLRLSLLWPSLHVMAKVAARLTDQFLVAGDEIEETYRQQLGVHPSRIVRFNPSIDSDLFTPLEPEARERERVRLGIGKDDVIIVMNGRLAPEKGLHIALSAVAETLAGLPSDLRSRLRMIIAGEGPARGDVEAMMHSKGLNSISLLLGEAEPLEVATLLGMSDVFLYTSLRGTNTSLAVLEAMAAGCAVVASERPQSHAKLLADGRGVSIPPGDLSAVRSALSRVLLDPRLRAEMGRSARDYIVRNYSPLALRRALLRATYYSPMQNYGVKS